MKNADKFKKEIEQLFQVLGRARRVLITAPGTADGDSLGAQLALRHILAVLFPKLDVQIINDEEIPPRYLFLPCIDSVLTPEKYKQRNGDLNFDVGIIVDGGVDRAGRVESVFRSCNTTVLIDHHIVSAEYPYTIRIVEAAASSTTEVIYHMAQTPNFKVDLERDFAQFIYLGLIFDTGFFRHSNTTPEAMELGAKLIRAGFDFTRVGERGMLERSFSSLQLLSYTLSCAQLRAGGKIIWSKLTQENLKSFNAAGDDKEGIIDHLFLTSGIEVALLFFGIGTNKTKISFRSQGEFDVAHFARELTLHGGGHQKAAGANLEMDVEQAVEWVLERLEDKLNKVAKGP